MKKTAGALLGVLMMLMFVSSANAAWTYEQTFNNLNNGDLNGQDSWSGSTAFDVVTTGTPYEGAKHLSFSTLADIDISRNITPTENGTLYFSVKKPTTNQDTFLFILKNNNGLSDINIYFNANGQIQAYNGTTASWQTIQNYSANSYYRIGIQFELSQNGWQGLAQRTYKVNIDGGAWSAAKGVERSNGITINSVRLSKQGYSYSGTGYFDFISPNYSASAPTISSVSATNITQTSATTTWTTDVPATSQVEYGPTTSYGTPTTLDSNLVYSHNVNLTGLNTDTLYHYRVKSKDAANNEAISADYTFHTAVAPLSLRLPFRDGEEWGITCYYNGQGGTGCGFHTNADAYALDFNLPGADDKDRPVLAVAPGKIETANYCSPNCAPDTYGNYVMINHGNGYKSRYAHLGSINVKVGQYIFQGEQIGVVGDSGAPGNYHLHLAYYKNGDAELPEPMSGYTGFQSCDAYTAA